MPAVTVWLNWKGLPIASTHSPILSFAESPHGTTGRSCDVQLEQRDVGRRIGADEPSADLALVGSATLISLDVVADDVVVRDDVAIGRDDDARSEAQRAPVRVPKNRPARRRSSGRTDRCANGEFGVRATCSDEMFATPLTACPATRVKSGPVEEIAAAWGVPGGAAAPARRPQAPGRNSRSATTSPALESLVSADVRSAAGRR